MFRNLISVSVCLFTMASCSTDWLEQLLRDSAARQVDITELIPQVPVDEVVSFTFIIPKPFLIPFIQSSSKRGAASTEDFNSKWYEEISIDSIPMDEFLT